MYADFAEERAGPDEGVVLLRPTSNSADALRVLGPGSFPLATVGLRATLVKRKRLQFAGLGSMQAPKTSRPRVLAPISESGRQILYLVCCDAIM